MVHIQHAAELQLEVAPQPDDTTCGPTCLHAVYAYYGDRVPLRTVIEEVPALPGGGTLAVTLASHALRRGYDARILTYNLQIFDPTWFAPGVDVAAKLRAQRKKKRGRRRLEIATDAYLEFLALGGVLGYEPLTAQLVRRILSSEVPILTGLSSTYLYDCARVRDDEFDDVGGSPEGHFVVLSGYDRQARDVQVADPLHDNPGFGARYRVGIERLLGAILLGILTYDANLLMITPRDGGKTE